MAANKMLNALAWRAQAFTKCGPARSPITPRPYQSRAGLALALLLSSCVGWTQVVSTTGNANPAIAATSSPVNLSGTRLLIGGTNAGVGLTGGLNVLAGGNLTAAQIVTGFGGLGTGTATIDGTGSIVTFSIGASSVGGLDIGSWGTGSMSVTAGAAVVCTPVNCPFNNIANAAGSTGTLTIGGAGTSVTGLGSLTIGSAQVNSGFGTPGASNVGTLQITGGALLGTSGSATLSTGPTGALALGTEHTTANVTIAGAGSTWEITRNPGTGPQAQIAISPKVNATATVDVTGGGQIVITGSRINPATDGSVPGITLTGTSTTAGATSTFNVNGVGSAVVINGDTGFFNVGRNGGTATLNIINGGQIYSDDPNGLVNMNVARVGSHATLNVDGAGSKLTLSGICGVNTGCDGHGAFLGLGRNSGSVATASVTNGGAILVRDGGQAANGGGLGILVGWDDGTGSGAGSGSLTVSGVNSSVTVLQTGAGTKNPFISVGDAGKGTMTVTDHATVAVNGTIQRNFIVGNNAGGDGTLTVSVGAAISASWFTVGNNGGTGVATIDNAAVNIDGVSINSQTNAVTGGGIRVGRGTGSVGTLNIQNGASVTINTATTTPEIYLGGTGVLPGGNGTVNMFGAATVSFTGGGATPNVVIGHSGTGLWTMGGGSTLSLPTDGTITLGATSTGVGQLEIRGSSNVQTGSMIVGNSGQGTVLLSSGTLGINNSDINANAFVVGNNAGSVGTFTQNGGSVQAGRSLTLGQDGGTGTYNLNAPVGITTPTLNVGLISVGFNGTGTFNQQAGTTNTVASGMFIGAANGTYNQSGGNVSVGGQGTIVGTAGVGAFNQSGGTHTTAELSLAQSTGAAGTYQLSGTGSLIVTTDTTVGRAGTGSFVQTGGSHSVGGTLYVGGGADFLNGTGTYQLSGGTLTAGSTFVGQAVSGTFNQDGGSHNTGVLWLGNCGGCNGGNASGTYNLSGNGALTAGSVTVGGFGHGVFTQSGTSTATIAGDLTVGSGPERPAGPANIPVREGIVTVSGGNLNVGGNVIVGAGNAGTVGGFPGEPGGKGSVTQTGGNVTVAGGLTIGQGSGSGANAGGTGEYVLRGGTLTVTGQTIVGGGGADSSLGGIGTLFVLDGATMNAGTLLGIGSDANGSNGAKGTVILDGGANIFATNIAIGAGGCLGGNGTVHGSVVMNGQSIGDCNTGVTPTVTGNGTGTGVGIEGFLKPGRSPGRLVIDGGFDFISGTIVLDVQADPNAPGGFLTDELVFTSNSNTAADPLDLAGLNIVYAFLGNTDPNAFAASNEWNLNTFFKINNTGDPSSPTGDQDISMLTNAQGALVPLDTLFADSSYAATSPTYVIQDFTFDPATGVDQETFTATPVATVPEPSTIWLLLLGSLLLLRSARMRRLVTRARRA